MTGIVVCLFLSLIKLDFSLHLGNRRQVRLMNFKQLFVFEFEVMGLTESWSECRNFLLISLKLLFEINCQLILYVYRLLDTSNLLLIIFLHRFNFKFCSDTLFAFFFLLYSDTLLAFFFLLYYWKISNLLMQFSNFELLYLELLFFFIKPVQNLVTVFYIFLNV